MLKYNEVLKKYNLIPNKYTKIGNVSIIDTNKGSYVFKKRYDIDVLNYLKSRNFLYYPNIIDMDDEYIITEYISDSDMPLEQRIDDMIDLVSLMHNKTTHYKCVSSDDYKKIYEDISNNIVYLYEYYNDIMTLIETKIYMSPQEYFLALNISKIYDALSFSKYMLEQWYESVKDKTSKRLVVLHNNLKPEHFIRSDKPYLISWDKAKIDMPIFDLYKLYKNSDYNFDFNEALKRYEKEYPLSDDERMLLFILVALPDKIEFSKSNVEMCTKIYNMINIMNKTSNMISPYYFKNTEED